MFNEIVKFVGSGGIFLNLVTVGILWGVTNPLIKRGTPGIEKIKKNNKISQLLAEIAFLACNLKFLYPFLINQAGSLIYFITLPKAELSLAVPLTNAVSFLCTAVGGWILGEEVPTMRTLLGMGLVGSGICCYIMDKLINQ